MSRRYVFFIKCSMEERQFYFGKTAISKLKVLTTRKLLVKNEKKNIKNLHLSTLGH